METNRWCRRLKFCDWKPLYMFLVLRGGSGKWITRFIMFGVLTYFSRVWSGQPMSVPVGFITLTDSEFSVAGTLISLWQILSAPDRFGFDEELWFGDKWMLWEWSGLTALLHTDPRPGLDCDKELVGDDVIEWDVWVWYYLDRGTCYSTERNRNTNWA